MLALRQIFFKALKSTSIRPGWWIFALMQFLLLSVASLFAHGHHIVLHKVLFLLLILAILSPVVVGLWLDIATEEDNSAEKLNLQTYWRKTFNCFLVIAFPALVIQQLKIFHLAWVPLVVFSSLLAATGVVSALYSIICNQSAYKSYLLAVDTWHKKISFVVYSALAIILSQGAGLIMAKTIFEHFFPIWGEFSGLEHSATIWLLVLLMLAVFGFIGAFLNAFLVKLFVYIIRQKKAAEPNSQAFSQIFADLKN